MSNFAWRLGGGQLAAAGAGFTAWAVLQGSYTSVSLNLGSGVIRTNYNQAFAWCASPLGQLAVGRNSAIAVTCQNVGNMTALVTVMMVCGILAVIGGALIAILVPILRHVSS